MNEADPAVEAGQGPYGAAAGDGVGSPDQPDDHAVAAPGRGMPELRNLRRRPRGWWITPLVIGVACVAGAVWTVHGFVARHEAAAKARRDALQDQPAQGRVFDGKAAVLPLASAVAPVAPVAVVPAAAPAAMPPPPAQAAAVRSYYDAPLLATGGGAMTVDAAGAGAADSEPRSRDEGGPSASQHRGGLAQLLALSGTPRARAGFTGNRSLLLAQGAKIDCAGDTAFDSTLAGIATCTVTRDVYSDDGRVVLIERGSQINSEYRSNLAPGQKRVFILAARIRTPDGVSVEISSPVADALGRMGTGGYVDNHWGERIGAAMLLGLTQDAIGYLATRGGNSSSTTVFDNTEEQGNSMAARVLDSTISIAPTLTQNQGAEFTIVLARDLDFSTVYRLEPEGGR